MSEAVCYFSPRQARLIVALISFGGFFLWILFGSYSYLPATRQQRQGPDVLTAHRDGLAQRSEPIEAEWRHGRRLLSVNESSFNCSLAHLVTEDGKKVKLDDSGVRTLYVDFYMADMCSRSTDSYRVNVLNGKHLTHAQLCCGIFRF